jgi:hypothetical protein
MPKRDIIQVIFFGIMMIALAGIIFFRDPRVSSSGDPCEIHKELFAIEIDSGVVKEKYVDRENHAMKTVVFNVNNKDYELLFIPYDNWTDFDRIKINDVIRKLPNSFVFFVDNGFKFELKLDCKYNRSTKNPG